MSYWLTCIFPSVLLPSALCICWAKIGQGEHWERGTRERKGTMSALSPPVVLLLEKVRESPRPQAPGLLRLFLDSL